MGKQLSLLNKTKFHLYTRKTQENNEKIIVQHIIVVAGFLNTLDDRDCSLSNEINFYLSISLLFLEVESFHEGGQGSLHIAPISVLLREMVIFALMNII